MLKVIKEKCPQNHICPSVKICPVNALKQDGYKAPEVDYNICIECGACSDYCPKGALVLE